MPSHERAVKAPPVQNRPAWHAFFKDQYDKWHPVLNRDGRRIVYTTPQAALEAASFTGAAWRLAQRRKNPEPIPQEVKP